MDAYSDGKGWKRTRNMAEETHRGGQTTDLWRKVTWACEIFSAASQPRKETLRPLKDYRPEVPGSELVNNGYASFGRCSKPPHYQTVLRDCTANPNTTHSPKTGTRKCNEVLYSLTHALARLNDVLYSLT